MAMTVGQRRDIPGSAPTASLTTPISRALSVAMTVNTLPASAITVGIGGIAARISTPSHLSTFRHPSAFGRQGTRCFCREHFTYERRCVRARRLGDQRTCGPVHQMTALDCDQRPATDLQVDLERASTEYRLRRGVRELGRLRQPQNVLEFLAVAKQRGHEINLRVFNAAIAAVATCHGGSRYALALLALMNEERLAPDRFTLTAVVASCIRAQEWDVACKVLAEMERLGLRPLHMRSDRLISPHGDTVEGRVEALRRLEALQSSPSLSSTQPRSTPSRRSDQDDARRIQASGGDQVRKDSDMSTPAVAGVSGDAPVSELKSSSAVRPIGRESCCTSFLAEGRRSPGFVGTALRGEWTSSVGGRESGTKTFDEMVAEGERPRRVMFLSELKAAALAKDSTRAIRLLDGMGAAGYKPHPGAYASAIRACGKAGKWEHSLALMDDMRSLGLEPTEGCHVMALKACATAGLWERALGMLDDMRTSGVNLSESSFVVVMKACGDAGRWKEALALMSDMRRDGVLAMETTYTTVMKACGSAGQWQKAVDLLDEMRRIGIPPTELCFTAVIRGCSKADETENAMSLLREMRAAPGVRTNMSVYSALIAAYCRSGDWAAALGLLEDARKEQHKPATGDFRMSLKACAAAGQHDRALSLLEEMRSRGMNMRRTGDMLWWVFEDCRDKRIKARAWTIMEVEESREHLRLRALRNAEKASVASVPSRT